MGKDCWKATLLASQDVDDGRSSRMETGRRHHGTSKVQDLGYPWIPRVRAVVGLALVEY